MTILEAGAQWRSRRVSSRELTLAAIGQIERHNPALNAFLTITADEALTAAAQADDELARGVDRGPLHGLPIAHKDLFDTAGTRTTYGSILFTNHMPDRDADVVAALRRGGAISLGKLGLHELAYGITSTNPHYGAVRNPWNPEHVPGGSSGGSGVAVATGMAFLATGTDTGGSIRIPASFCGVAGLKPTYGLLSTAGCRPLSESLDHMGPLTATAADLAPAMECLTSDPAWRTLPAAPSGKWRIGVPGNFFFDHALPEVAEAVRRAAALGGEVVPVRVEAVEELVDLAIAIILAEAADSASDILEHRAQIGADVLARFDQGRAQDPQKYVRAQRMRIAATRRFVQVFDHCDVLITPASPTPAPAIGNNTLTLNGVEYDLRLATTRLVRPINLAGIPAVSMPCGLASNGLPMGLQILAPHFADARAVAVACAIERQLAPIIRPWN